MLALSFSNARTLKLTNVLFFRLGQDDYDNIDIVVQKMRNYISSKGKQAIGPLIQQMQSTISFGNVVDMGISLMIQANAFIPNVEPPFSMHPILRVPNCCYCRFHGNEEKLKVAYDKISVTAYEQDINLNGDSYTVFVDQQDDILTADIFMPRADAN